MDAEAYEKAALRLQEGMEKEFAEQNNSKLERALKGRTGPGRHLPSWPPAANAPHPAQPQPA